jgi:hypothetical protein
MAAYRIERALREATGVSGVTVIGYAGDYGGYFTTEEEYEAQHYEGAHTLYGRNAANHIRARLVQLVEGPAPEPIGPEEVTFDTGPRVQNFSVPATERKLRDPKPQVTLKGRQVTVRWHMPADVHIVFAEGYFVRLQESKDNTWHTVQHHGHDFDDLAEEIEIVRHVDLFDCFRNQAAWRIRFRLPWEPLADRPLRVQVAARINFPGFTAPIL